MDDLAYGTPQYFSDTNFTNALSYIKGNQTVEAKPANKLRQDRENFG